MVHYCCVFDCFNTSLDQFLSFHGFPDDIKLKKLWITSIKRDPTKVNKSTKVCSDHFTDNDYKNPWSRKRRLKEGAIPSVFRWSKDVTPRSFPENKIIKIEQRELDVDEETETASEGEGSWVEEEQIGTISRGTQTQTTDFPDYKSTNTSKCLVGVNPKGRIMFVSYGPLQVYTQDKEIVARSGFNLLTS